MVRKWRWRAGKRGSWSRHSTAGARNTASCRRADWSTNRAGHNAINHCSVKTKINEPTAKELFGPLRTQCGPTFEGLGIRIIAAGSPEAKGRVERNLGTHQDRLVKKLQRGHFYCTLKGDISKNR